MTELQIPAFLLRNQEKSMSAPAPAAPPAPVTPTKTRRKDAYIARLTIAIPLDMSNADSLATAIKAVAGIKDALPAGAQVEVMASLGKI